MRKIALVCSLLLATDAAAGGAVFAVDSTLDAVDALPGDALCATAGGACTLRAAIQESNALGGSDLIQVPAGTYALSLAGDGEELAATGDLDVRDSVVIVGGSGGPTIVDGGALDRVFHVQPMNAATLTVVIDGVTIRNGALGEAGGAGVLHQDEGSLVVSNAVIEDNVVTGTTSDAVGGGVDSAGLGELTIRDTRIEGNAAPRGAGVFTNGIAIITDVTFTGNVAATSGVVTSYGTTTVERSTFTSNQGPSITASASGLTLVNSTLSGNTTAGAAISATSGALIIASSTIANETASFLVYAFGPVSLVNSALVGDIGGTSCVADGGGSITSLGGNLDDDGSCAGGGPGDLPSQDPLLGPLADNGGPTLTHLPQPGSPLANAGRAGSCPGDDQRGVARDVGAANGCDIGAVEFAVPEPSALALGVSALLALTRRRKFTSGV